jgi:hypothetical protein
MSWNHIIIEGFCWDEKDDNHPCGQHRTSSFCLGYNGKSCPNLGFSDSNEREASAFVPLRLIIWDRIRALKETVWDKISWFLWGQLWFNRRKVDKFLKSLGSTTVPWFDEQLKDQKNKFPEWLKDQRQYEDNDTLERIGL